jgi:hypothetical protein
MATPKLAIDHRARAAEIPTENILPLLPDGRSVVIGKRDFYLVSAERCSCGDNRYAKRTCKHMIAFIERMV